MEKQQVALAFPGQQNGKPYTSWRMAHEMNAAGFGFLWPRILFVSQGDDIIVKVVPSIYDANRSLGHKKTVWNNQLR